jgi:hypothetical protein
MAFAALFCGGITLFFGSFFGNPVLVISAAAIFGIYESLFWTSYHQVREQEHGSSKQEVARWNTFEKLVASFFLFFAAFWSDFSTPELCMGVGLIFAMAGIFSTRPLAQHRSERPIVETIHSRKPTHLALPLLEGMVAVSWIFYVRQVSLDGTFSKIPLIGSGIVSLGIIAGTTALLGATMYYISSRYKWNLSLQKTLPLQIVVICGLIFFNQHEYWILILILIMSLLRSMMLGQTVNDFRKLLARSGSAHDTRERMKFTGRVAGLLLIVPYFTSIEFVLMIHLASITILLLMLHHCSRDH